MTPISILVLAAAAALVLAGAHWGFGNRRLPVALRPLLETGTVFILLGAALGPFGANVLTAGLLAQLSPVIVIGLGWIGFLFGTHFEWRLLRRYSPALYSMALLQALVCFALVAGFSWLLLTYGLAADLPAVERLGAAAILGICAMGTAPAGVFHLSGRRRIAAEDVNLLRFLSAVDDLPAIVLLGVLGAVLHPLVPGAFSLQAGLWLVISIVIGVGLGLITHWLFPTQDDIRHNSLVLLGIVALGAGAAAMLHLSPLFVTVLGGIAFANLSSRKERAYGVLAESEHSLYTVFLLVAGLLFRIDGSPLFVLVPAYLLLRGLGKLAGGYAGRALFLPRSGVNPLIGAGMLFQGGMALAMAVSLQRTHLEQVNQQATTTVVFGVVVFELIAPFIAVGVLAGGRRP